MLMLILSCKPGQALAIYPELSCGPNTASGGGG
jgi:hypothetical protein